MKKALTLFSVVVLLFSGCSLFKTEITLTQTIIDYALSHDKFTLSEIKELDFEWDVVHVDQHSYGLRNHIFEKNNLDASVLRNLETDSGRRLLFFHNNSIVKEVDYRKYNLYFSKSLEMAYPTTIFQAQASPEGLLMLNAHTVVTPNSPIDISMVSYADSITLLLENDEVKKYAFSHISYSGTKDTLHPSRLHLNTVFDGVEMRVETVSYTFCYESPENTRSDYFEIGSTKVDVDITNGTIVKIENFNGSNILFPFESKMLIENYEEALDITAEDLYALLAEALSNNYTDEDYLELLSKSSISFEIGNDGFNYIKCFVQTEDSTDDILSFEWRYEENIWA